MRLYPWEQIDFIDEFRYWTPDSNPWRNGYALGDSSRYEQEMQRMQCLGIRSLPMLIEAMPILIASPPHVGISDCVRELQVRTEVGMAA